MVRGLDQDLIVALSKLLVFLRQLTLSGLPL